MFRPIEVKALEPYRIWLRYEDGTEGEVDLSNLAGRGIFAAWEDREVFESVRVGEFGEVVWGEEALVEIGSLAVMAGRLRPRVMGLVVEWASLHQENLEAENTAVKDGVRRKDSVR